MNEKIEKNQMFNRNMLGAALKETFLKLKPNLQIKNPVMFLVYVSAIATTILFILSLFGISDRIVSSGFIFTVAVILWITCLFANFSEAVAEGRGKAQAAELKKSKRAVMAKRLNKVGDLSNIEKVSGENLNKGDLFLAEAGETIAADGEVVEGAASVDESAITGESAPVIREAGGDRSAVTGGTTVLSDHLVIKVTQEQGASFLDKMIGMVEGANRKKTPNEIALEIFLVALSIIFVLVVAALYTYSQLSSQILDMRNPMSIVWLIALLVCLAPTTIGALLSAIGIAGMSRLNQANVLAMSGRAIEAAGDTDVLLLDKTGTITLGNRRASAFIPVDGHSEKELAIAAQLSSLADETPEGRSIVVLAKEKYSLREQNLDANQAKFIPFSAQTKMSGVNFAGDEIRKGASENIKQYVLTKKINTAKNAKWQLRELLNREGHL
ncbi:potassium-transporting ATPase B chain [Limosilactobacillus fermentum]|nr:potassium-transporting ATPase B chain [Limosilactobacillus fermentum]